MDEDRLVEIETKIAFQEKTISDLNEVVCQQQQDIERLGTLCDALAKRVKMLSEFMPASEGPANDRPPHY